MKKAWLIVLAATAVVAALSVAGPAAAAVTCSFSSNQVTIAATGNNTSFDIVRNGTAIQVNGAACGAATVNNTATIKVNGALGRQQLMIDFSGGAFVPGFGADTGVAEIEFAVDLKLGTDSLILNGLSGVDNWRIGADGINFNGDGDVDITMLGVEDFSAYGNDGADVISAAGGLGTGAVYPRRVSLDGGNGPDTLTSGSADNNYLYGGSNNDTLNGGDGTEILYGQAGADQLNGGNEADTIYPGFDNA